MGMSTFETKCRGSGQQVHDEKCPVANPLLEFVGSRTANGASWNEMGGGKNAHRR